MASVVSTSVLDRPLHRYASVRSGEGTHTAPLQSVPLKDDVSLTRRGRNGSMPAKNQPRARDAAQPRLRFDQPIGIRRSGDRLPSNRPPERTWSAFQSTRANTPAPSPKSHARQEIGTSIFRKPLFRTPNWKSVYGLDKNRLRGVFKKMNQGPERCGEKNDFVVEE